MPEHLFPERNEYIDKYLFPFEKGEELEETGTQYFELTISVGKFLTDSLYLSSIPIPADVKYCVLDVKFDAEEYNLPDYSYEALKRSGKFEILERINEQLDAILPHSQIEYLYCGFQIKNITKYTNLKTLILEYCDIYYELNNLPASLLRLEIWVARFSRTLDNLPPNLKVLRIDTGGTGNYCSGYPHPLNNLPSGLEILYFPETISMDSDDYPANFEHLPSGLKYLYLQPDYAKTINFNLMPDSVEVIEIHNFADIVTLMNKYPASLKKVYTHCNFNREASIWPLDPVEDGSTIIKKNLISTGNYGKFDIYVNVAKYNEPIEYNILF